MPPLSPWGQKQSDGVDQKAGDLIVQSVKSMEPIVLLDYGWLVRDEDFTTVTQERVKEVAFH